MGLVMACYLGLYGTLSGLTKSTDHPSSLDPNTYQLYTIHEIEVHRTDPHQNPRGAHWQTLTAAEQFSASFPISTGLTSLEGSPGYLELDSDPGCGVTPGKSMDILIGLHGNLMGI